MCADALAVWSKQDAHRTETKKSNMPAPTKPMTPPNEFTPTEDSESNAGTSHAEQPKEQRKRPWIVCRIVDYRLQALAPSDPDDREGEQDWADVGGDTTISLDREAMFQLARTHKGLLLSANGLPGGGRMAAFAKRLGALMAS